MKKILTSVVALFLSMTVANAQWNAAKSDDGMKLIRSSRFATPMPNVQKSPAGMQKIQLDADEKIMGFYTSDDLDMEGGIGLPDYPGNYMAGAMFAPETIGKFYNGQITKVRFGLMEAVGSSKVYIHLVDDRGNVATSPLSTATVATTKAGWNDVTLTTPVTIEQGKSYLIGFDFEQKRGKFPLLVDSRINENGPVYGGLYLNTGTKWELQENSTLGNLCIQAAVKGGSFIDNDLALKGLTVDKYVKPGSTIGISYKIKNDGKKTPTSYKLSVDVNGTEVRAFDTPVQLTDQYQTVNTDITIPENLAAASKNTISVSVTALNGSKPTENIEDDKVSASTIAYTKSFQRQKNVLEQFTATTCSACPYADPVIEALKGIRSDLIHIAHHNNIPSPGDKMVCDDALALSNVLNMTGNPSGCFNRYFETDPSLNSSGTLSLGLGFNPQYAKQAAEMLNQVITNSNKIPTFASIDIKTEFDEASRVLKIEVSGEGAEGFNELMDNNAGLSIFLLEDGLVYAQAGGTSNMVHNNVMRKAVTNVWGDAINWTGNTYKNTYEITLNKGWKEGKMNVVALINRPFVSNVSTIDGVFINNAEIVKLGTSTGINDAIADNADVKEVARYTLDGRQITNPVKGVNIVKMSDGTTVKVLVK